MRWVKYLARMRKIEKTYIGNFCQKSEAKIHIVIFRRRQDNSIQMNCKNYSV